MWTTVQCRQHTLASSIFDKEMEDSFLKLEREFVSNILIKEPIFSCYALGAEADL